MNTKSHIRQHNRWIFLEKKIARLKTYSLREAALIIARCINLSVGWYRLEQQLKSSFIWTVVMTGDNVVKQSSKFENCVRPVKCYYHRNRRFYCKNYCCFVA